MPLQLMYLNKWGHGSPFLVSSLEGLILSLALQHHAKWRWWSVKCRPLHLRHFASWIQQTPAVWPHFQQFLHCSTPGFMLAPQTVAIKLPTLNRLLMFFFALKLLCKSQILIQIMDMSDLEETLMIWGLEARTMSLNMWLLLRMHSTSLEEIQEFVILLLYEMPMILK